MNREVKEYLDRRFGKENHLQHAIRNESPANGLPDIQIPIHLGRLLLILAKIQQCDRILEIGTLGGYSAAWLAEGLNPQGMLISLEIDPNYAEIARQFLVEIKGKNVEIRVGHAVELLAGLVAENVEPFDLIFIDADKENYPLYLDWSIRLSRPGTMILIDNLIPKGERIGYPGHEQAQVVYAFNDYLSLHPSLEVAVIPTIVGSQNRLDGFAIARVK